MRFADAMLVLLALAGHTGMWVALLNRSHATALPHGAIRIANLVVFGSVACIPLSYAWWAFTHGFPRIVGGNLAAVPWYLAIYFGLSVAVALGPIPWWVVERVRMRPPAALRHNRSTHHDMLERLGEHPIGLSLRRLVVRLPRNEALRLEVNEKLLEVPRLPRALDGLVIAHLSDLHFCGNIDRSYFEHVADMANDFEADLVAVTGDLVDKPRFIDWIPGTLGRLRARYGVYFVLGNHDLRIKHHLPRLRQVLDQSGLVHLGGRWREILVDGAPVILAGNELPWLAPAADMGGCPTREERPQTLRILLSHSPDQFQWARRHDFDLMLAGHTHGGQIRFPFVGALFTPSMHGGKYASGTFCEPPTLMHVSRGLSGIDPLRLNCPPELTRLVLRVPASPEHSSERVLSSRT